MNRNPVTITLHLTDDEIKLYEYLLKRRYHYGSGGLQVGVQAAVKDVVEQEAMDVARYQMDFDQKARSSPETKKRP